MEISVTHEHGVWKVELSGTYSGAVCLGMRVGRTEALAEARQVILQIFDTCVSLQMEAAPTFHGAPILEEVTREVPDVTATRAR